jgi:hypothetical protein
LELLTRGMNPNTKLLLVVCRHLDGSVVWEIIDRLLVIVAASDQDCCKRILCSCPREIAKRNSSGMLVAS